MRERISYRYTICLALVVGATTGTAIAQPQQSPWQVLLDSYVDRHGLIIQLQPYLDQQEQLETQLNGLLVLQTQLRTQLQAVQTEEVQLATQAQSVAAQLQVAQNMINQLVTATLALEAQYSQLAASSLNLGCRGCPAECPDGCEQILFQLSSLQAEIQANETQIQLLVQTKQTLQAQADSILVEQQLAEAEAATLQDTLAQNALQQQSARAALVDNAQAANPIVIQLAAGLQERKTAWLELAYNGSVNVLDWTKQLGKFYKDVDEKFPCPSCPPRFNTLAKSALGVTTAPVNLEWGSEFLVEQANGLVEDAYVELIIFDPPDANYMEVYRPQFPNITVPNELDSLPTSARSAAITNIEATARIFAYLSAARVSLERYGAAVGSNDLAWAQFQRAALFTYLRDLKTNLVVAADSLAVIKNSLVSNPTIDTTVTPQLLRSFLASLQSNGFPQLELTLFAESGLSQPDIEQFRQNLLLFDPTNVPSNRASEFLAGEIESKRDIAETLEAILPTNQPPVCNSGGPYSAECHGGFTSAMLVSTNSTDPDGGILSYRWIVDCPNAAFDDPTSPTPFLTVSNAQAPFTCNLTLTVSDLDGATTSCETTFSIVDTTPPILICQPVVTVIEALNCQGALPNLVPTVLALDNCTPTQFLTVTQAPPAGTVVGVGLTNIVVTAVDASGNRGFCTNWVSVVDKTSPRVTCPADMTITLDPGQCSKVVDFSFTASDDCSGVTVSSSPASGSAFPKGTNVVTCTAVDASGNQATCSFLIRIEDHERPQIQKITANPAVLWPPNHQIVPVKLSVAATDNCGIVSSRIVSVRSSDPSDTTDWQITDDLTMNLRASKSAKGADRVYSIIVECKDESGNKASQSVAIAVPHDKGH